MATFTAKDAAGNTLYFFANSGSGTLASPFKTNAVEIINTSDINVSLGGESVTVGALPTLTLAPQTNPFTNNLNVSLNGESLTIGTLPNLSLASQPSPFTSDVNVSLNGESVSVSSLPAITGAVDVFPSVPSPTTYLPVRLTDGTTFYNATGGDGGVASSVEVTSLPTIPLPANAATDTNVTEKLGSLTEVAPTTDTASSGLNGRLQRIAQRLTNLISLLPTSLGQKSKAESFSVVLASDTDALTVSDSTAQSTLSAINTKLPTNPLLEGGSVSVSNQISGFALSSQLPPAVGSQLASASLSVAQATDEVFIVDGSAYTQPVSATVLPLPAGAATENTLNSLNSKIPTSPLAEGGSVSISNQISGFLTESAFNAEDFASEATLSAVNSKLPALSGGKLPVEPSLSLSPVSGSGSVTTANAFQEVFISNPSRKALFLKNTSDTALEIASGASAAEIVIDSLAQGESIGLNLSTGIITDRISVRSTSTGKNFLAWQA